MSKISHRRALENARTETLTALDGFLTGLGYLK